MSHDKCLREAGTPDALDILRAIMPSSACARLLTYLLLILDGVAGLGCFSYGDVHFYAYDKDCMDPSTYPRAKFVSEHGFQSMPSWHAISPRTAEPDWDPTSLGTRYRQVDLHPSCQH